MATWQCGPTRREIFLLADNSSKFNVRSSMFRVQAYTFHRILWPRSSAALPRMATQPCQAYFKSGFCWMKSWSFCFNSGGIGASGKRCWWVNTIVRR
jgi:hypothetical protein